MNHRVLRFALAVCLSPLSMCGCFATDHESKVERLSISQVRDYDQSRAKVGRPVVISGVVVADFREPGQLGGVFLQDAKSTATGNPSAMFLRLDRATPISVGDHIQVRGILLGGGDRPLLKPFDNATSLDIINRGIVAEVKPIELSLGTEEIDWGSLEGMLVRLTGDMVVTDTHDLTRYGQVTLSANDRLYVPTEYIDPNDSEPSGTSTSGDGNVSKVRATDVENKSHSIILDDGSAEQNPSKMFLLPQTNDGSPSQSTLRLGTKIINLTGVVTKARGRYMVMPAGEMTIEYAPRPPVPNVGDSDLRIASFNVLNYFTTIDNGSNQARGADTPEEFDRQQRKLVAALSKLDADVVGLMELENNLLAEEKLVAALNESVSGNPYQGVGRPDGFQEAPGGKDAICVGIIYRADRVAPCGTVKMVVDDAFVNARTPLVQEFRRIGDESTFTVIVNHFKSKGSRGAKGLDRDMKDGQGANNASRRKQAKALAAYVASVRQSHGATNLLILGDLNAYSQEDPIDTLRAAGLVDLIHTHAGDEIPYSYVYYGQAGCLDHAFATPELAAMVSGTAIWHINSSEPKFLDYNLEFNPKPFYRADAFRSSDHDPVLVGIDLP
ncbi:ExeM/NucH family extracellular endonuclease [Neorhodopirellula lusitana]|uniref:ExeM/NucH family extracellular endonuclease n=1 Tax=Neorhodopirellula lusitana TaxID=445327 RepID=UPI00384E79C3